MTLDLAKYLTRADGGDFDYTNPDHIRELLENMFEDIQTNLDSRDKYLEERLIKRLAPLLAFMGRTFVAEAILASKSRFEIVDTRIANLIWRVKDLEKNQVIKRHSNSEAILKYLKEYSPDPEFAKLLDDVKKKNRNEPERKVDL